MTIRSFYEGGMILFDRDLALHYEIWLARMLSERLKRWWEKAWWLRDFMYDEFGKRKFDASAFYAFPGDPLVSMPDVPRVLLLKGRYLHRLRLEAIKRARREYRCIGIPKS